MASGRKYNRIPLETRKRIIESFEKGEDWRLVARFNGVNYHTAYKWLHVDSIRYEPLPRTGHRKKILNDTEIDEIMEWIAADPAITLTLLKIRIKAEFTKDVSITSISSGM